MKHDSGQGRHFCTTTFYLGGAAVLVVGSILSCLSKQADDARAKSGLTPTPASLEESQAEKVIEQLEKLGADICYGQKEHCYPTLLKELRRQKGLASTSAEIVHNWELIKATYPGILPRQAANNDGLLGDLACIAATRSVAVKDEKDCAWRKYPDFQGYSKGQFSGNHDNCIVIAPARCLASGIYRTTRVVEPFLPSNAKVSAQPTSIAILADGAFLVIPPPPEKRIISLGAGRLRLRRADAAARDGTGTNTGTSDTRASEDDESFPKETIVEFRHDETCTVVKIRGVVIGEPECGPPRLLPNQQPYHSVKTEYVDHNSIPNIPGGNTSKDSRERNGNDMCERFWKNGTLYQESCVPAEHSLYADEQVIETDEYDSDGSVNPYTGAPSVCRRQRINGVEASNFCERYGNE